MAHLTKKDLELIEHLRVCSRKLVQELGLLSIASKEEGLPPSHWHTLIEIQRNPKISAKELSSRLLLEKSTMSRILKDLKTRGYISIKKSPEDKRESEIFISKKGMEKKTEIDQFSVELVSGALKNLRSEQVEQIIHGIHIYSQALEKSRLVRDHLQKFEISEPKKSDLEALAKLHVAVFKETFSPYMPKEKLKKVTYQSRLKMWQDRLLKVDIWGFYRIVKVDGDIGGFVAASISPRDKLGFDSELVAIYIREKFHKMGIGKILMRAAFDFCRSKGAKNIYLWVAIKNVNAVDFYTKLGGKKERFTKVEQGLDHVCISWKL